MMQTSRSLFLLFYIFTIQELLFTTQEQRPKYDFSHSFHPQTLLIFVSFGNEMKVNLHPNYYHCYLK